MNDLLIRQVRVVSEGEVSEPCDVLLAGGVIAKVSPQPLDAPAGTQVIDGEGAYLSPGWIDLHAHIFPGISEIGLDPDRVGLNQGVHLVVDAGSAGATTFPGFRDYVVSRSRTAVRALLNISAMGLIVVKNATELPDLRWVHLDETIETVRRHPDLIRGIKVRASGLTTGHLGLEPLKLALQAAEAVNLPVMVHVGETPPELPEVLDLLRPGDMITHCFHGKPGGIFGYDGELIPALLRAMDRGVWLDIGHGAASYSMAVTRKALALGIRPHTISTDLHVRSVHSPVHDLATTMTKLLAAGLTLPEVVAAVTERPARWLQEEAYRTVAPGAPARLTLFRLMDAQLEIRDAAGATETVTAWIKPVAAITPEGAVTCP
jgi:dihydroorotase